MENDPKPLNRRPANFNATLNGFQSEIFDLIIEKLQKKEAGLLLNLEMGMGKTYIALAWLQHLVNENRGGNFLIVAPKSTIDSVWSDKIKELTRLKYEVYTSRFDDELERRILGGANNIILITYELMTSKIKDLSAREFTAVIFDEGHRLKNSESELYRAALGLKSAYRFILTATPIENNLRELYNQLHLLNPDRLDKTLFETTSGPLDSEKEFNDLKTAVKPYLISRRRSDSELPPITQNILLMKLKEPDSKYLEENRDGGYEDVITSLNKRKLNLVVNLTQYIRRKYTNDKIVIFSNYTTTLRQIQFLLSRTDIHLLNSLCYDGSLSTQKRESAMKTFRECDIPILLISKMAGGFGIDLTCANHMIFVDSWWNPQIRNQAIARCRRPGQTKETHAHSFHLINTIEDKIMSVQRKKETLFNDVLFDGEPSAMENRIMLHNAGGFHKGLESVDESGAKEAARSLRLKGAPEILIADKDSVKDILSYSGRNDKESVQKSEVHSKNAAFWEWTEADKEKSFYDLLMLPEPSDQTLEVEKILAKSLGIHPSKGIETLEGLTLSGMSEKQYREYLESEKLWKKLGNPLKSDTED